MNKNYIYTIVGIIFIIIVIQYIFINSSSSNNNNNNNNIELVYVPHFIKKTNLISDSEIYNVPLVIYHTWNSHNVPINMKKNLDYILINNPEFDYYLYDDYECKEFIQNNFNQDVVDAFESLIPGAYKADLWRYCILYKKGGVYMDIKLKPLVKLKTLINNNNFYYVNDNPSIKNCTNNKGIYNAFIISYPNNIIFKLCINAIVENCKNQYYGNSTLDVTGPCLLGNIVDKYYNYNYDKMIHLYLKTDGSIYDLSNRQITDMYEGYRNEQKKVGTRHYSYMWFEKKIFKIKI